MSVSVTSVGVKRVRAFLARSFSHDEDEDDESDVVELFTPKQVVQASLPYVTGQAVFEASFDAEREEKREILRAVSCALFMTQTVLGDKHISLRNMRSLFHWCAFCENASSARGPGGVSNACAFCAEEIPCAAWCTKQHWEHVSECAKRRRGE